MDCVWCPVVIHVLQYLQMLRNERCTLSNRKIVSLKKVFHQTFVIFSRVCKHLMRATNLCNYSKYNNIVSLLFVFSISQRNGNNFSFLVFIAIWHGILSLEIKICADNSIAVNNYRRIFSESKVRDENGATIKLSPCKICVWYI